MASIDDRWGGPLWGYIEFDETFVGGRSLRHGIRIDPVFNLLVHALALPRLEESRNPICGLDFRRSAPAQKPLLRRERQYIVRLL